MLISRPSRSRIVGLAALFAIAASPFAGACSGQVPDSKDADERFDSGEPRQIESTIRYEEKPGGPDIQGPTSIERLLDSAPSEPQREPIVWYALASDFKYPQGDDRGFGRVCDTNFGNKVYSGLETTAEDGSTESLELPATIRGVITYHASHYQKVSTCGQDQKYFGSYMIQDKTGTISVLRDAEIADYSFGDRVEVEVKGLAKSFGSLTVLTTGDVRLIASADESNAAVPYTSLTDPPRAFSDAITCEDPLAVPPNLGDTFRIEGRVCQEPTSRNFNQLQLQPAGESCRDDPPITWNISMGLDFGRRGLDLRRGDRVRATGPVWGRAGSFSECNWDFEMLALSSSQIQVLSR